MQQYMSWLDNMQFKKLLDEDKYPNICFYLENRLSMHFEDLRCLLQLPLGQLKAGCNFATASVLFNIIGGLSVCFFNPSLDDFKSDKERGRRFIEFLIAYYPDESELIVEKETEAKVLYDSCRNPLTHSLGLYKSNERRRSRLVKRPLTIEQIESLENRKMRPRWLSPTITLSTSGVYGYDVNINTLYWGVCRLVENLLADSTQLDTIEIFLFQLNTEYSIKGLRSSIESLNDMCKDSPQYEILADGIKYMFDELLKQKDKLTPTQNDKLESLLKEYKSLQQI